MQSHTVNMLVSGSVAFPCEFRAEAGAWLASCDDAHLQVRGDSFEDAKRNMESALQAYLISVLRDNGSLAA
jgi:predicted RNase H-like HicB family nuclease